MSRLIALRPVLYLSKQYGIGDELPVNNPVMVEAWIQAESAKWKDEAAGAEPETPKTKVKRATAEPGIEGRSDSGPVLQGKVPKTPGRAKK